MIKLLSSGKSPALNSYSNAFYKQFKEYLAPILNATFNAISESCSFLRQSQEAHINLVPKDQKDYTLCSSYRPGSLINVD